MVLVYYTALKAGWIEQERLSVLRLAKATPFSQSHKNSGLQLCKLVPNKIFLKLDVMKYPL